MPRLMFVAALAVCTLTAPVLAAEMPATPYAGQECGGSGILDSGIS